MLLILTNSSCFNNLTFYHKVTAENVSVALYTLDCNWLEIVVKKKHRQVLKNIFGIRKASLNRTDVHSQHLLNTLMLIWLSRRLLLVFWSLIQKLKNFAKFQYPLEPWSLSVEINIPQWKQCLIYHQAPGYIILNILTYGVCLGHSQSQLIWHAQKWVLYISPLPGASIGSTCSGHEAASSTITDILIKKTLYLINWHTMIIIKKLKAQLYPVQKFGTKLNSILPLSSWKCQQILIMDKI